MPVRQQGLQTLGLLLRFSGHVTMAPAIQLDEGKQKLPTFRHPLPMRRHLCQLEKTSSCVTT